MRRPLVWIASAFIVGIAGQGLAPAWIWWLSTAIALGLTWRAPWMLGVAIIGLGALAAAADLRVPADSVRWPLAGGMIAGLVDGAIVDDPVWRRMPGRPATQEATMALQAIDGVPVSGQVRLRQSQPIYPLRFGDQVRVRGAIRLPKPPLTAGGFDEARWLWQWSIDGVLEASRDEVEWIAPARGWRRAVRALFDVKHRALGLVAQRVDPLTAALLGTLLAGERTALPRAVTTAFADTGTIHLLSVSGWHVTLIGGVLWAMAATCLPRRPAAIATLGGLLAYCVLTGAQPPIVRSTIAGGVLLIGLCMTRAANALNTLALAALAILWVSPRTLWMPAFQLSFASVAALLALAPIGAAAGRRWLAKREWRGWRYRCAWIGWQSLVVSVAAWLATWPLVALHLPRLSLIAWLANLWAVPLATLVMVTGLMVTIGGLWLPGWLLMPWIGAVQWFSHQLVDSLTWCAQWSGAAIPSPSLPWWVIAGWYGGLVAAAWSVNNRHSLINDPEIH